MEKFFERIEMPQRRFSKAIRVLKFLDKDKNFKSVDHDLQAAQSLKIEHGDTPPKSLMQTKKFQSKIWIPYWKLPV